MEELGYKIGMEKGRKEGLEEGRREGKKEGEHDKAIQIATDMKKEGLDIAIIVKMTKLSLEEVEKL